ncbi:hypothetical protein DPMN_034553 [Dreissena polymorpha]|uniref:Plastocyanin-like domain-containing protein n=1 Tax=Dreissena polymorpha TaxID=45954 RepID=A0A9D4M7Q8_DREPO|nr:hypothetical protein DPMN_034553 [Dreissena polymorpha]
MTSLLCSYVTSRFVQETLINRHNRVGSRFSKYVYKEYSDSSFRSEIPKLSSYGLVGPLLHGEVGEVLRIHFRNEAEVPLSVHPHGVRYTKSNEGVCFVVGYWQVD